MINFEVKDKIILVTGAGEGIGLSIANALNDAGALVIAHERNEELMNKMITNTNFHAYFYADFSIQSEVDVMLGSINNRFERIDTIVNSAGVEHFFTIADFDFELYNQLMSVNLTTPIKIVKELLDKLHASDNPSVINISSIHDKVGVKRNSAYCISKAGLEMFMKVAALELANSGIRVNNIGPGAILTGMNREIIQEMNNQEDGGFNNWIPLGRVGETQDVAAAVIFLASNASKYMTGETIYIDGGYKQNLVRY